MASRADHRAVAQLMLTAGRARCSLGLFAFFPPIHCVREFVACRRRARALPPTQKEKKKRKREIPSPCVRARERLPERQGSWQVNSFRSPGEVSWRSIPRTCKALAGM